MQDKYKIHSRFACIPDGLNTLEAHVNVVKGNKSWVIFTHGSGSSHKSKRNKFISDFLNEHGISTLLFDLLTEDEDIYYRNRFHIPLLADRLVHATEWLVKTDDYKNSAGKNIGFFGGSTGAGVILEALVKMPAELPISGVVSRGGRSDLVSSEVLKDIRVPVHFIVGGADIANIELNKHSHEILENSKIDIIPGAGHLFTEPGALEKVAEISLEVFERQPSFIDKIAANINEVFAN